MKVTDRIKIWVSWEKTSKILWWFQSLFPFSSGQMSRVTVFPTDVINLTRRPQLSKAHPQKLLSSTESENWNCLKPPWGECWFWALGLFFYWVNSSFFKRLIFSLLPTICRWKKLLCIYFQTGHFQVERNLCYQAKCMRMGGLCLHSFCEGPLLEIKTSP